MVIDTAHIKKNSAIALTTSIVSMGSMARDLPPVSIILDIVGSIIIDTTTNPVTIRDIIIEVGTMVHAIIIVTTVDITTDTIYINGW
jgi:hypothetical protein